jgi:hypothetical protein
MIAGPYECNNAWETACGKTIRGVFVDWAQSNVNAVTPIYATCAECTDGNRR